MIEATNSNSALSFQNMQKMHVNDTISTKDESDTQNPTAVNLTMDTAIFSQTAMDLSQNKNTSLLSILENQSQGETPAERAADGRRAANAMRVENEAEDLKLGTLVIEDNQEAMEENIEERREEAANSENATESSSSSPESSSTSSSTNSSTSTKSETSSETTEASTASE